MPGKGGRPKGSHLDKRFARVPGAPIWLSDPEKANSVEADYKGAVRYYVVLPLWEHVLTAAGAPVRHLGKYITIESALHAMRYAGLWLVQVQVWDSQQRRIVGALEPGRADGPNDNASAPGAIEFYHLDKDGETLEHTFYAPDEFIRLLLAGELP